MSKVTTLRARISGDPGIRRQAVATLEPNAVTAETLRKSARGEDLHTAEDAADLFRQLDIEVRSETSAERIRPGEP